MRRRHLRALLAAFLLGANALGCGAILGIDEEKVPPAPRGEGGADRAVVDVASDAPDAADAADAPDDGAIASDATDAPAE